MSQFVCLHPHRHRKKVQLGSEGLLERSGVKTEGLQHGCGRSQDLVRANVDFSPPLTESNVQLLLLAGSSAVHFRRTVVSYSSVWEYGDQTKEFRCTFNLGAVLPYFCICSVTGTFKTKSRLSSKLCENTRSQR